MIWNPGLTQLRDVFAELYPEEVDSRRIVADAELNQQYISFTSKAINTWQAILAEAHKQNKVETLARVALKQYPQNKLLQTAVDIYRKSIAEERQETAVEEKPVLPLHGEEKNADRQLDNFSLDIFISYSHHDKEYTHRLVESLEEQGFQVWIDDRIDYGSEWPREIQTHLEKCSVFVLIMTPRSDASIRVQNELAWVLRHKKPIFPLLLEGDDPWLSVASIQHIDVRSGELPPETFYENIRRKLPIVEKAKLSSTDGEPDRKTKSLTSEKGEPGEPEAKTEVKQAKTPPSPEMTTRAPVIHLRSEPLTVSRDDDDLEIFGLNIKLRPLNYIENDFEARGQTVLDHATGLLWQQSGSDKELTYEKAEAYIEKLNHEQFAGYTDWRLPTVEELMSLLEPRKRSYKLYINPVFNKEQWLCWSIDKRPAASAWFVDFYSGIVTWHVRRFSHSVRAVRAWQ